MDNMAALQATFDATLDNFNIGDAISIENANHVMRKNWRNFLKAGFDVDSVVKMMAPEDIWNNYQDLTTYGAKINITKLVGESFDEEFIKEHWSELVDRGISPDLLIDWCNYDVSSVTELEEIIAKGVSVKKAFSMIEWWLECRKEWPEEQVEILTWLYNRGLPKEEIKAWLAKATDNSYLEDFIVESDSDFYEKLDLMDDAIIDRWLSRYGYRYFTERSIADLPEAIGVDRFLQFFSMEEIIKHCAPYSLDVFVTDFVDAGQDINILAQKFMNEIGYDINRFINKAGHYIDSRYSDALLSLIDAESSTDIIDPMKCIESIDASRLDDRDARNWYYCLEEKGYDSQLISKFFRED